MLEWKVYVVSTKFETSKFLEGHVLHAKNKFPFFKTKGAAKSAIRNNTQNLPTRYENYEIKECKLKLEEA